MRVSLGALVLAVFITAPVHAQEFEKLFNGKDLTGWEGDTTLWSVQDGVITGVTTLEKKLPYNKFLIHKGEPVKNFHLRGKFRLEGDNNSGVQYRSQHLKDKGEFVVGGYQADIHPADNLAGMLYDERGRGILAQRGQKVVVGEDGKPQVAGETDPVEKVDLTKWTDIEVLAVGNHLVHKINGKTTVDVTDNDPKNRDMEGIIALQIHAGPAMKIQFKDLELKRLPADAK